MDAWSSRKGSGVQRTCPHPDQPGHGPRGGFPLEGWNVTAKTCKHRWVVTDKTVFKSAWEQAHPYSSNAMEAAATWSSGPAFPTTPELFSKKSITILSCKRCGALDKTEAVFEPKAVPESADAFVKILCAGCFKPLKVPVGTESVRCTECGRVANLSGVFSNGA
jgi:LSD1 subclass zinc finger protein